MNEPTLTDTEREELGRVALAFALNDTTFGGLAVAVARIKAEAVDRESAAWVTKIEAFAASWTCDDPGCDREGGDFIRDALLAADDTEDGAS